MSFILDALRKSEHERQRQTGPTVAELPIARPGSRSRTALLVVAVLLAVNLGVVLFYLLRPSAPAVRSTPAVQPAPAAAAPAAKSAPATPTPAPTPALPPIRPPAAAGSPPPTEAVRSLAEEAAAEPARPPLHTVPSAPDPSLLPPAPRPAAVPARQAPATQQEYIPRIDSLPPEATAGLPKLNLDLHVYATDPAQRAVFINGQRYREGDVVAGGARIEAITPEGAVLRYKGQRFLLPRP